MIMEILSWFSTPVGSLSRNLIMTNLVNGVIHIVKLDIHY